MAQIQQIIFDDDLIQQSRVSHTCIHLGNFYHELYDDCFDSIANNLLSMHTDDVAYKQNVDMVEAHRIEKYDWCPQFLTDLLTSVRTIPSMDQSMAIGFMSERSSNGYNWHADQFDLFATNIVGESIWYFEDDTTVHMKPYDVMFIPMGLFHRVEGLSNRFTAAVGCNIIKKEQQEKYIEHIKRFDSRVLKNG